MPAIQQSKNSPHRDEIELRGLLVLTFIEPRPLSPAPPLHGIDAIKTSIVLRCIVELCPWTSILIYHPGFARLSCTQKSNHKVSSVQLRSCSPWHKLRVGLILNCSFHQFLRNILNRGYGLVVLTSSLWMSVGSLWVTRIANVNCSDSNHLSFRTLSAPFSLH